METLTNNLATILAAAVVYILTALKGRILKLVEGNRDFWLPVGSFLIAGLVYVVPDEWGVTIGEGSLNESVTHLLVWASANVAGSVPKKVGRNAPHVVRGVMRKKADT